MAARHPNAFPKVDPTLWACRSSSSAGDGGRIFFICGRGTAGLSVCEKVEGSVLGFAVFEVSGYKIGWTVKDLAEWIKGAEVTAPVRTTETSLIRPDTITISGIVGKKSSIFSAHPGFAKLSEIL